MTDRAIKQHLAAILCADAVGYSRLMARDERGTLAALDAARAVFRSEVAVGKGRIVDTAGDSVLAVFESAVGALHAALRIQARLAALGEGSVGEVAEALAEERRLRFRVGVHLGDVIEKADGSVYGDGVNIAARLQALAEPGQVLVSEAVHAVVRGKVEARFDDGGEHRVKNIEHPLRVWRASTAASIASKPPTTKANPHAPQSSLTLPERPSLAVLPFTNMSGDAEQEYFADGVVDDIITALSRVRSFFVIARNSSFTYKGKAVDIKQVGRDLGVRYVLEGSIRRAGNRVRIVGQLIEAENGRHVWADRFEGPTDDVFELQDRITESVAGAIEPTLKLAEIDRARSRPADGLQPYELCLRALPSIYVSASRGLNDEAIALLERAITLDPGYSYAKALCAFAHALRRGQGWATVGEGGRGIALAEQALADHRDDPSVLSYAGHALSYLAYRHAEALHALDRALALNPNSSKALASAGWVRAYVDDTVQSIAHFRRALRLSPLDPEMGYILSGLGYAHCVQGDVEQALELGIKSVNELPNWTSGHQLVAMCLGLLGRIEQASVSAKRLLELDPTFSLGRVSSSPVWQSAQYRERRLAGLRAAGIPE